jgi:hypothetical protein
MRSRGFGPIAHKAEHEALLAFTNELIRDAEAIMARAAEVRLQSQKLCTEARRRQTSCPPVLRRVELACRFRLGPRTAIDEAT